MIYSTMRARATTVRLVLFAAVGSFALLTLIPALLSDAAADQLPWFYIVIAVLLAVQVALQFVLLIRTRHPIQMFEDRIVISSLMSTALLTKHITGRGIHRRRGDICLEYHDAENGHQGQIALPWRYVAEDTEQVAAALDTCLARRQDA